MENESKVIMTNTTMVTSSGAVAEHTVVAMNICGAKVNNEIIANASHTTSSEAMKGCTDAGTDNSKTSSNEDAGDNVKVNSSQPQQPVADQQNPTRRCARFAGQNIKIAEKAEELTRKRNLEGTNLTSKNSFSVLSDENLMNKSNKMGVAVNINELDFINVIKDLEVARHTLETKRHMMDKNVPGPIEVASPSVEQQLLGWHSESSDDEGFQLVSYKRSRKNKKKVTFCGSREKYLTSPSEDAGRKGRSAQISSGVPPRKGKNSKKSK